MDGTRSGNGRSEFFHVVSPRPTPVSAEVGSIQLKLGYPLTQSLVRIGVVMESERADELSQGEGVRNGLTELLFRNVVHAWSLHKP